MVSWSKTPRVSGAERAVKTSSMTIECSVRVAAVEESGGETVPRGGTDAVPGRCCLRISSGVRMSEGWLLLPVVEGWDPMSWAC